ncbi:histidinol-phosphate aminotransferase [Novimethylophilus kurashikiensis]|uniref:Histidinol-phosphate aminotransferase n=1 Tax=Novimethylophilus kurashikiensis TaxID=1825523 RepID=A0A2R5FA75_9PROT|nr:histidinol-phosphate transaminase [Novimethylophilus kurashikiensis]GBG15130.1 histidinol-phosphate aminotransferase [Novimethylophilus kurashikiensis]
MKNLTQIVPSHVRGIAPYQPGKPISELAREMGLEEGSIVKLASNENPLGVSPKALAAMAATLQDIARYPDGNGFVLKDAISRKYGIAQSQIVLGNGSNDVLELAARAFLSPGTEVVFSQHAFAVYPLVTQAIGAVGVMTPAKNYGHDLDAMLAAITQNTRMIFVANPNNPTGTWIDKQALHAFLSKVPNDVMVVLDEAYDEYLPDDLKSEAIGWIAEFDNLILTRTLSKAYGLAGLRVGFLVANAAVADMINRVRQPFNVNNVALAAAAAVLDDEDFVRRTRELNDAGMKQLTEGVARLGLEYIPSYGNFVCVRVENAMEVYRKLLQKGVIVRPVGNYELPDFLRVSIGLESENARFLQALEEVLQGR